MGTWGARLPRGHPAGHSGRDARRRWGLPSQGEGEAPPGPAQQQLGVVGQALPARFGAEEEPVSQPRPAQQLLELQRFPLQVPLPFPGEESRTQPLPLALAEKTRQQVSPWGGNWAWGTRVPTVGSEGIHSSGWSRLPWGSRRGLLVIAGPGDTGSTSPRWGCHPHVELLCMGCPCIPP